MSCFTGICSVSRSSVSGSGLPSLSRQISPVSSRSASAARIALRILGFTVISAFFRASFKTPINSSRFLYSTSPSITDSTCRMSCCSFSPALISAAAAFSSLRLLVARLVKVFCSHNLTIRSSLASKFSRRGCSIVTFQ